jgi:ATP-binding cassette subfamily B protein
MSLPVARARHFHSLWRIRSYCAPYLAQMIIMALAASVSIAAGIVVPLITESVIDGPVEHHRMGGLILLGTLAILFGIVEAAGTFLRRWLQSHGILSIEMNLRNELYAHLQRLEVAFHDNWHSGQLLSRAMTDISTIRRFLGFGLIYLVVNISTYVVVAIILIHLNPLLGIVVTASAIPVVLLSLAFERRYQVVSRAVQDQQGDLTTRIEEGAQGIRVIKSFGRRREMLAQYLEGAQLLYETSMRRVRLEATFFSLLQLVPNLTLPVVLIVGGLAVADHTMTLGALVAFMSLLLLLAWPVESLGFILASAQEAATAADRVFEVFDTAPSIAEPERPRRISTPRGALRFAAVHFAYPGSANPVLDGVELEVEPGETVAIVGTTGSGKTTLLSLVPRLREVSSGAVKIDGVDVREISTSDLRHLVGVAFEDPILFSASVRENVLLGVPGASEDDLEAALRIAQAGFIDDLPWGLDTRVGEQGLSLSGGQRQRLALARAIVGRPRLLVLDDPLSALDVHTEAEVEAALASVLEGTTALIVAHRPSTVALADRVALLDAGRIVATGSHSELMGSVPAYRAVLSEEAGEMPARS